MYHSLIQFLLKRLESCQDLSQEPQRIIAKRYILRVGSATLRCEGDCEDHRSHAHDPKRVWSFDDEYPIAADVTLVQVVDHSQWAIFFCLGFFMPDDGGE